MKHLIVISLLLMLLPAVLMLGCYRDKPKADIPDTESLYLNIRYLDSLLHSDQVDSIGVVQDNLTATIGSFANRARSADEKAVLDSLQRIAGVVNDFLRLCASTHTNLELLEQDIKTLETDYRSGKIKTAAYVSDLLEAEQIMVDIHGQLASGNRQALEYLHHQSQLVSLLQPAAVPGN